ncbi:hypothetical protein Tsubulata_019224 [Turnera subulata]|uniref:Rho termination factor-like N-terminal domain-containing protein n=1 Tax=Turnera subulata TaxID=218843 RepID=A0A9Q0J0F6_9ROSI|nr:hypothetical protein Tsubulata_019224 [Turnera subulata]
MVAAAVSYNQTFFSFPSCFNFRKQLKLGYSLKDGCLAFALENDELQLCLPSTRPNRSYGDRPVQKGFAFVRAKQKDEEGNLNDTDGKQPKSSEQKEIIALFRRIRSSISKEQRAKKRISPAKSVNRLLEEVLDKSTEQRKDAATKRDKDNVLAQKKGVPKKEKIQNEMPQSVIGSKFIQPPTNFVSRSPIPAPSDPGGKPSELKGEATSAAPAAAASRNELELPRIEEMKLAELRGLAKSRGIKGYSKLKKGELQELLRS